jgi:diguanylate cyclase (GGDEF)-like protein/PAS domain S-box-containing protein
MPQSILFLASVFALLFLSTAANLTQWRACADSNTPVNASSRLIAAIPLSFPPQYTVDERGEPSGFAIDVMNAVAEQAGYTIHYRVYDSWPEVHQAVMDGEAHLIPNMGITPEREAFVDFTSPVETFRVSVFVRDDSSDIQSLDDLSNRAVGVIKTNVAANLLNQKPFQLKEFIHFSNALVELISGHIDAVAYPDPVVWRHAKELGLEHRLRPLSPPLIEIKRAIGVRKFETELLLRLNNAVEEIIHSKSYEKIYSKWYAKPQPYWNTSRGLLAMLALLALVAIGMLIWRYHSLKKLNLHLVEESSLRRNAEQQLQQLNTQLEETVRLQTKDLAEAQRIGQMGSWVLDLRQNQLNWSDEIFRIFEIDPDRFEATYESFLDTIHPDDRSLVNEAYQTSLKDMKPYSISHRLLFPGGRMKWVIEQCETQFDDEGNPLISRGTVQDVTERKASERQLALTQYAVDHISEGAYLITSDGYFHYVNAAACESLGYRKEELLTMHVTQIDPSITQDNYPDIYNKLKERGSLRFEAIHQHRDGHTFPVEIVASFIQFEDEKLTFAVARDISDIKAAQMEVERQHALLQQVIDGVSDSILMIDTQYTVRLMNAAARATAPANVLNNKEPKCFATFHHFSKPCEGNDHPCPLHQVIKTGQPIKVVHKHTNTKGTIRTIQLMANPLFDKDGNVTGLIESGRDVTDYQELLDQLKRKEHRLDHIAHHDSLTGLPNRLLFVDRLQQAIFKAKRSGSIIALLFIDLDRFKQINDSFGHPTGDQVLRQAANRLQQQIREEDTIARIGGDEFTVILHDVEHTQDIAKIADKLLRVFDQGFLVQDQNLILSTSIGICIYPQDGSDANTLIRNADSAMYKAKEQGRNAYSFYTSEMTTRAFERLMMENSLRSALDQDQLVLHYQPQINMQTGRIVGVEALVRWNHPELGLIPPAQFITLSEETGLIQPIGEWVLRTACRQAKKWHDGGMNPARISVNCNLSERQLKSDKFHQSILAILQETRIEADLLELEITETTIMDDPDQLSEVLNRLRDIGVKVAIDDFGTGYSSLAYLKSLPISKLKIDKSFVRDIPGDPNDAAITRAIVNLGESLQMQVIAEGVETEAQAEYLQSVGCFLAQGFLYAEPMAPDELERFLKSID